ncbi:hypothetical protein EXE43_12010 [Halorubrum sp. SS5]|nr:hypothetical protein EXE43_12010 [Halorubrum sp. SS5]
MGENDTTNALLTNSQRSHIVERGTDSAARNARSRARKRLYETVTTDAPILYDAVAEGHLDAETTLDDGTGIHGVGTDELAHGLRDLVSLVYLLAEASRLDAEKIVEEGADRAERRVVESRIDKLEETYYKDREELTFKEMKLLVEEGRIPKQQFNEALDRITE